MTLAQEIRRLLDTCDEEMSSNVFRRLQDIANGVETAESNLAFLLHVTAASASDTIDQPKVAKFRLRRHASVVKHALVVCDGMRAHAITNDPSSVGPRLLGVSRRFEEAGYRGDE